MEKSQNDKKKRGTEISGKNEQATREKITVQLEEINRKVLAKEGRLKRYRQRVKQYRQNEAFQKNERKFYQQLGRRDTKTYQQLDANKPNDFGQKYGNQRNVRKMLNGETTLQEN